MTDLTCFTAPQINPERCPHAPEHRFTWFARDDTAPGGQVLCQVCMACDTVVSIGAWKQAQVAGEAPKRTRRRKDTQ